MNFAAEVARFSRIAEEKGLVNSLEGNLSMIDRETGNIYITPSHKMKCLLSEEQICVVNSAGEQIGGTGKSPRSFFSTRLHTGQDRISVQFSIATARI